MQLHALPNLSFTACCKLDSKPLNHQPINLDLSIGWPSTFLTTGHCAPCSAAYVIGDVYILYMIDLARAKSKDSGYIIYNKKDRLNLINPKPLKRILLLKFSVVYSNFQSQYMERQHRRQRKTVNTRVKTAQNLSIIFYAIFVCVIKW